MVLAEEVQSSPRRAQDVEANRHRKEAYLLQEDLENLGYLVACFGSGLFLPKLQNRLEKWTPHIQWSDPPIVQFATNFIQNPGELWPSPTRLCCLLEVWGAAFFWAAAANGWENPTSNGGEEDLLQKWGGRIRMEWKRAWAMWYVGEWGIQHGWLAIPSWVSWHTPFASSDLCQLKTWCKTEKTHYYYFLFWRIDPPPFPC